MFWHLYEIYIRVSGKWRYLRRIVDEQGSYVDFRLSAKRNCKAAKAFLNQARRTCGHYPTAIIVTTKHPPTLPSFKPQAIGCPVLLHDKTLG